MIMECLAQKWEQLSPPGPFGPRTQGNPGTQDRKAFGLPSASPPPPARADSWGHAPCPGGVGLSPMGSAGLAVPENMGSGESALVSSSLSPPPGHPWEGTFSPTHPLDPALCLSV